MRSFKIFREEPRENGVPNDTGAETSEKQEWEYESDRFKKAIDDPEFTDERLVSICLEFWIKYEGMELLEDIYQIREDMFAKRPGTKVLMDKRMAPYKTTREERNQE